MFRKWVCADAGKGAGRIKWQVNFHCFGGTAKECGERKDEENGSVGFHIKFRPALWGLYESVLEINVWK